MIGSGIGKSLGRSDEVQPTYYPPAALPDLGLKRIDSVLSSTSAQKRLIQLATSHPPLHLLGLSVLQSSMYRASMGLNKYLHKHNLYQHRPQTVSNDSLWPAFLF